VHAENSNAPSLEGTQGSIHITGCVSVPCGAVPRGAGRNVCRSVYRIMPRTSYRTFTRCETTRGSD